MLAGLAALNPLINNRDRPGDISGRCRSCRHRLRVTGLQAVHVLIEQDPEHGCQGVAFVGLHDRSVEGLFIVFHVGGVIPDAHGRGAGNGWCAGSGLLRSL